MADAILADSTRLVTGGIDTHKDFHVAAVVDGLGAELATKAFPTTNHGYLELTAWLVSNGALGRVGVEGCGSWGAGIARHLTNAGLTVVQINRPNRQMRRGCQVFCVRRVQVVRSMRLGKAMVNALSARCQPGVLVPSRPPRVVPALPMAR